MWWFWAIARIKGYKFNARKLEDDPVYRSYMRMQERLAQLRKEEGGFSLAAELIALAFLFAIGCVLSAASAFLFRFYFAVQKVCELTSCETLKSDTSDVAACLTAFAALVTFIGAITWTYIIFTDRRQVRIKARAIRQRARTEVRQHFQQRGPVSRWPREQ